MSVFSYDYWDSFDCQLQCDEYSERSFLEETEVDEDEVDFFGDMA